MLTKEIENALQKTIKNKRTKLRITSKMNSLNIKNATLEKRFYDASSNWDKN